MLPTGYAARAGRLERRRDGPPPRALAALLRWVREHFSVDVEFEPRLPDDTHGVVVPLAGADGSRGLILVRHDTPWPRWVIAHELGHLLTGNVYGVDYCRPEAEHMRRPAERAANEWAAAWLLDIGDLLSRYESDWCTSQIATREDVPECAVLLRMELSRLLREFAPARYREMQSALFA